MTYIDIFVVYKHFIVYLPSFAISFSSYLS